ncbi:ribonuclease H-like domain-containing protein [Tanacetum coccineum]
MCDKKNSVLFTETECLILSPDFKLPDENQVMLKIPWKDNMYSFDLKNVVPSKGLTCLIAKAINDESNMWHRRLGHINFKTMNKLVKGNLVRGLPSNFFENDHSCVACQKGKQYKATFKIIRCDNGTEFKNYDMNQFCGIKRIKREFSNARTPQQNGVAERKNRTLIEAARTMLADSLLHIPFWAEAVNTACYVQNRVLVTKPHNKTPYELLIGRTPIISFMRPFGCPVTILNTLDHLGKFDGKVDERFLVGSGPEWLFDIDTLTNSMNYQPVSAGNRTNGNAGLETNSDAGQAGKENVPDQEYILLPLLHTSSNVPSNSEKDESSPKDDAGKKNEVKDSAKEGDMNGPGEATNTDSTNRLNTVSSPVNTVSSSFTTVDPGRAKEQRNEYESLFDPLMPDLEDTTNLQDTGIFESAYDDEYVGAEADLSNLETNMSVSPIPTTKIHKDHSKAQIIGEVDSAVQTRRMHKQNEAGLITFINKQRRTNHKDFQNCLFACFLSQMEPKKRDVTNTGRQNPFSQAAETSIARKVNTARPIVNEIRLRNNFYKSHSPIRRPLNKSTTLKAKFTNNKVNTAGDKTVSAIKGYRETAVMASADPLGRPKSAMAWVGDEVVHKELGDRMERAATTASSLEAEQDSGSGPRKRDCEIQIGDGNACWNSIGVYTARHKLNTASINNHMANLEFYDKHNMIAYLQKSEGSEGFHQIIDFLNASHIQYALIENPTIYVSFIKQFWRTATARTSATGEVELIATIDGQEKTITEASLRRHLKLEDNGGVTTLPNSEIFKQLALIGFIQICLNKQRRLLQPHTRTFPTHVLTQKVFSNMKRVTKGYSGEDIPLFASMITAPETSPSRITYSPSLSPQHTPFTAPSTSQPSNIHTTPITEEAASIPHELPLQSVHSLRRDEGSQSLHELTVLCTNLSNKVTSLEAELEQTKQTYGTHLTKLIKKGRSLIKELDLYAKISLVPPHDAEIQEKISDDTEVLLEEEETTELVEEPTELVEDQGSGEKGEQEVTTADTALNTASVPISTASANPKVSTATVNLVYIKSAEKRKDKGKAIMIEDKFVQNKSKKQLEQERLNHEEAIRLQEQVDEEERKMIARDAEIAKQLQEEYDKAGKKEAITEVDTAHVIDWNDPSIIRYHALQNRPRSVAKVRKNMMIYLKNRGGYKMKDFKGMSYDDIRPIFEKVWDQIHSFVPMDSEKEVQRLKRAGEDVETEPAKRQRTGEVSESVQEQTDEEPKTDELSQEQLNQMVIIAPYKGINVEALQTKYTIIRWEVYSDDTMQFWKIIRVGNHTEVYQVFEDMLKNFDGDDLIKLWSLVQERYNSSGLTEDKEIELWVELKMLFEPNVENLLELQKYMHNPLNWWLYDTCAVHCVSTEKEQDIFMLVEKDYLLTKGLATLMLVNKLRVDQHSEMADKLLTKIYNIANRPRN